MVGVDPEILVRWGVSPGSGRSCERRKSPRRVSEDSGGMVARKPDADYENGKL